MVDIGVVCLLFSNLLKGCFFVALVLIVKSFSRTYLFTHLEIFTNQD